MMCNYMRFGGLRCDLPDAWLPQAATRHVRISLPSSTIFEALLAPGTKFSAPAPKASASLPRALAVNAGVTGPGLRASGVNYDIRKVDHYGIYDRFKFRVPLGERGDVFDRYMVRVLEMRESIKILDQAMRDIPAGPIIDPKAKLRNLRPKLRRSLRAHRIPKGELGFYLISDGGADTLSRFHASVLPVSST